MSFLSRSGERPIVLSLETQWAHPIPALCKGLPHRWYPFEHHETALSGGVRAICLRCRATDPPPRTQSEGPRWHR